MRSVNFTEYDNDFRWKSGCVIRYALLIEEKYNNFMETKNVRFNQTWVHSLNNSSIQWLLIRHHFTYQARERKKIQYLCHFKFYIQKKTFHLTFCFPGQFNQLNFLLNEKTGSVLQWLVEGWRVKNLFERWMSRLAAFPPSSSFSLSWQESLGNC